MKKIVVGLDASAHAAQVLREAVALARARGATLSAVRAVAPPADFPVEALAAPPAAKPEQLVAIAQRSLDQLINALEVPRELLDRVEARYGAPWLVLCDAARELDAVVLVVGTHGFTSFDRQIGTTAARVVNHAPCSVLLVRVHPAPGGGNDGLSSRDDTA